MHNGGIVTCPTSEPDEAVNDMLAHALQAMCMTNRALYNKYVHVTLQISHLADAKPNVRQTITHAQAKV